MSPHLAQVNIGGIIRQGAQVARNADLAADCREAADWLAILDRELPPSSAAPAGNAATYGRMMNLFRDDYFVPLMGKPYSRTTPQERTAYHQRALRLCGPQQLDPQRLAIYNKYKTVTNTPFLVITAAGGVTAAIAEIEGQIAWTKSVTQTLDRATFDQVDGYLKQAQTNLTKVWPREQQEFITLLTGRQRTLAPTTLDAALAAAQQPGMSGLESARAIAALHTSHASALQLLDTETAKSYRARIDAAVASALKTSVEGERRRLAAAPAGLDGVIAINAWRRTFESNFQGFSATPESTALLADAARRQSVLLAAGVPEFKQLVAQHPKPVRNGIDASQLLDQLFPDAATRALPEFAQYRGALDARLKALADATAAENARRAAPAAPSPADATRAAAQPPPRVTAAGTPTGAASAGPAPTAPSPAVAPASRSLTSQANVAIVSGDDVLKGVRAVSLQADVRGRSDIREVNIIENVLTPTLSAVGLSIVDAGPNVPMVTLSANMLYGDPAWAYTVAIEVHQLLPTSPQPNAPLTEAITWRRANYGLAGGLVVNGVVRQRIQAIVNEFAATYRSVNQGGPALSSQTAKPATPLEACVAWGSQKAGGAASYLPWCQCMIAGLNSEPRWWAPNLQLMMSDFGAAYGRLVSESPDLAKRVMNACNR